MFIASGGDQEPLLQEKSQFEDLQMVYSKLLRDFEMDSEIGVHKAQRGCEDEDDFLKQVLPDAFKYHSQ
jgi:hypothetical protein